MKTEPAVVLCSAVNKCHIIFLLPLRNYVSFLQSSRNFTAMLLSVG